MTDKQDSVSGAMDRAVQSDRIISTEAIMLPIDQKLTDEQIKSVRQAVRNYVTDGDGVQFIPYNQVAAEIGKSGATISEFMRDKYKGNNDALARSLNLWLDRHRKRERSKGRANFITTWAAERIAAYVNLADRRLKMAAIVGPSGCGKDMVIGVLAEQLGGHVIYCDTRTTATQMTRAIADAIGVKVINDTAQLQRRIIKRLKDRKTILFVNEAQTLAGRGRTGAACAGLLRSIYDQAGVPIVLFGSAEILGFIDDRDPASGGGQLYRRCLKLNLLNAAQTEEDPDRPGELGRPLFSKAEVRKFLAMKQVKLADADAFELLWHVANLAEHGSLGLCGDVIDAIADLWPGDAISCEHIYTALTMQLDAEADVIRARIETAQAGEPRRAVARAG